MLSDDLSVEPGGHGLLMEGTVECRGDIYIAVRKDIRTFERLGTERAVRESYSYHAVLRGEGSIFRYEGPHPTHHQFHHVHRYAVLAGGDEEIERLEGEETPTLGEVIDEARRWYWKHYGVFHDQ